jgi:hypothetical protein
MTWVRNEDIHEIISKEGMVVAQKGDWQKWWHYAIPAFFWAVGIFNGKMKQSFYKDYVTCVGNVIYFPNLELYHLDPEMYAGTLWHEYQHFLQYQEGPLRFMLGYILSRDKRAHYEYQAYSRNLVVYIQNGVHPKTVLRALDDISTNFEKPNIYLLDEKGYSKRVFESIYAYMLEHGVNHGNFLQHWPDIWHESSRWREDL